MSATSAAALPEYRKMVHRPDSLGRTGRRLVLLSLCGVSFTYGLAFAALGAWLVLPYSALEMAFLYWAFHYVDRITQDWERLTLIADEVIVEHSLRGRLTTQRFSRHWVRARLESVRRGGGMRLVMSESGRVDSFGEFLTSAELERLAKEIRALLAAR